MGIMMFMVMDGNGDGDDGKMCLVVSRLPQDKEGKRLVLRRYCTVYTSVQTTSAKRGAGYIWEFE